MPLEVIRFLRFPLSVAILVIHAHFSEIAAGGRQIFDAADFPVYGSVSYILSEIVARVAVPMFFAISGYLFFRNAPRPDMTVYTRKIRRRLRSLVVPYICWNLISIALFWAAQSFLPQMMAGVNKPVSDYSFADWCSAFWNTSRINPEVAGAGYPTAYQFWFIRDLFLLQLFSPLVYMAVRRLKFWAVAVLGVLWLGGFKSGTYMVNVQAMFFFTAGAYLGINGMGSFSRNVPWYVFAVVYAAIVAAEYAGLQNVFRPYLHRLGLAWGVATVYVCSAACLGKTEKQPRVPSAGFSFFVFAFFNMPVAFVTRFMFQTRCPSSEAAVLALYFAIPVMTVLAAAVVYFPLRRLCPALADVLVGWRK